MNCTSRRRQPSTMVRIGTSRSISSLPVCLKMEQTDATMKKDPVTTVSLLTPPTARVRIPTAARPTVQIQSTPGMMLRTFSNHVIPSRITRIGTTKRFLDSIMISFPFSLAEQLSIGQICLIFLILSCKTGNFACFQYQYLLFFYQRTI